IHIAHQPPDIIPTYYKQQHSLAANSDESKSSNSLASKGGFYTALCVDVNGLLLAGKCEKDGNAHIEIYHNHGHLLRIIDSHSQRLRRPCSLAT
ncbi:unnamed protein product, partial [Rotaria magnacalcarata]